MTASRAVLLLLAIVPLTYAGLVGDVINRARRHFMTPEETNQALSAWNSIVQLGLFINSDTSTGSDVMVEMGSKRSPDSPLHMGSGSGSGSGSSFTESAKRDNVPKPGIKPKSLISKALKGKDAPKVEMEKSDQLSASATQPAVEEVVQGEEEKTKRKTVVTCEGEKEWLECPQYHLIKINSAFWGRNDTKTCTKRESIPGGLHTDKECAMDEADAMRKVQTLCHGEGQCELVASRVFFGSTDCPMVYKYLKTDYECAKSESRIKESIQRDVLGYADKVEPTHEDTKAKASPEGEKPVSEGEKVEEKAAGNPSDAEKKEDKTEAKIDTPKADATPDASKKVESADAAKEDKKEEKKDDSVKATA